MATHKGNCRCGAVSVEVEGDPQAMLVCHCKDCRAWSASPVNGAALWPRDKLNIIQGQDNIQSYAHSEGHNRSWCTKCGGHVFTDHIPFGLVDLYASVIEDFDFQPAIHVNYESTIMPIKDGLPKFKDFPEDFGGSGETLPE